MARLCLTDAGVAGEQFDDRRWWQLAQVVTGGRGHDTFVFKVGEANGDSITDFHDWGRSSDQLEFHGYGNGTFTQVDATHWAIGYENNSHAADVIQQPCQPQRFPLSGVMRLQWYRCVHHMGHSYFMTSNSSIAKDMEHDHHA
jgi:hypothetical protein